MIILCLWAVMILSILGMGLTSLVFQEIKFSSAITRMYGSLPVAEAALKRAFYERKKDPAIVYDTMEGLTRENLATLCPGSSYSYYFADKKGSGDSVEIIDEGALININNATLDMLKRLPGLDEDMALKIANYGLRPYTSIHELLLVEGMTLDKFRLLKDMVTVYGSGKVNINTASKAVLACLGLDEELADIIIRFRKEHKIDPPRDKEGNPLVQEEEYGFSSLASLVTDLSSFASLSLRQEQDLISAQAHLCVKSDYLRFNIIPQADNKPGIRYSALIFPAAKKVISWKEY